ncbi:MULTISPECIES: Hpt domain-containing protein [unclassified Ectothiorhodospira]|uniref:hybrid sensor histidine kinase/response regulator n=1 Tax=unclassified Ectothiorhodospira TaxID=2684909 RepID=UPI001EE903FD|nr:MULTISPECIES: Hpt domain-containing protein [unclassified Ectothiorhodospira]MCG5514751.1 Hpt domain-containing protein [Ectothiorhodospira sp. 9100]MCG5518350.1 Hpt domain-containing protein [Ectothiorhodospira sp. 9905]
MREDSREYSALHWVKKELDALLVEARVALEAYLEDSAQTDRVQETRACLRQVEGTLQMVELYGAAMLAREMEALTTALEEDTVTSRDEAFEVLMRAILQLPDYLEHIQTGHRDIPIVLLPLLNDLRTIRKAGLLSENVLFFPLLVEGDALPVQSAAEPQEDVREWARTHRHHYQRGLLAVLRGQNVKAGLHRMDRVISGLRRNAHEASVRRLFAIAAAVTEALTDEGLEPGAAVKQLLGTLDRQIRALVDQGEQAMADRIPEELVRNLLYYVARARSEGEQVRTIQQAYRLSELVPDEADLEAALEGLRAPNQELMSAVAKVIREDLADVKDSLDVFMHSGGRRGADLDPLVDKLHGIADTLAMLGMTEPREIALREAEILAAIARGETEADEQVLMQAAAEMLNVEAAIGSAVAGDTGSAPEPTAGRLPPKLGGLSPTDSRPVLGALIREALADMNRAKEAIITFSQDPSHVRALDEVPGYLDAIAGALSILSLDDGVALLAGIRDYLRDTWMQDGQVATEETLSTLADAITAVECYLEDLDSGLGDPDAMIELGRSALARLGIEGMTDPAGEALFPDLSELPQASEELGDLDETLLAGGERELPDLEGPDAPPEEAEPETLPSDAGDEDRTLVTPGRLPEEQEEGWPPSFLAEPDATPEEDAKEALPEVEDQTLQLEPLEPLEMLESGEFEAAPLPETTPDTTGEEVYGTESLAVFSGEPDDDILEIFLEEADEELERIQTWLPRWHANPRDEEALATLRRSYHTLKGSGRLVGAELLGEFAWVNEHLLNRIIDQVIPVDEAVLNLTEASLEALPQLVGQIRGEGNPDINVHALMDRARQLASAQEGASTPLPAAESTPPAEAELTLASDVDTDAHADTGAEREPRLDPVLFDIYRTETEQHLHALEELIAQGRRDADGLEVTESLQRTVHTLNGSARAADVPEVSCVCSACERYLRAVGEGEHPRLPAASLDELEQMLTHVRVVLEALLQPAGAWVPDGAALETRFQALHDEELARQEETRQARSREEDATDVESPEAKSAEEPDDELMDIFLEEASDILNEVDSTLERWSEDLNDQELINAFQRQLHTLKGGARMAGITAIADLSHALESLMIAISEGERQAQSSMLETVHQGVDRLTSMVERAQRGEPVPVAPELVAQLQDMRAGEATPTVESMPDPMPESPVTPPPAPDISEPVLPPQLFTPEPEPAPAARAAGAGQEQVRVRADVLDNLVNFAGEVSIYHARMEQQITAFGFNLGELSQTIARLREQLRKLEMETEAQILFRHEQEQGEEAKWQEDFDPLELDRYSNIQQLSRALAESVNDLVSIQDLLSDQIRDSETLLQQQSRVSTELQEGLMHTRMVQFDTMAPRLRRIVRQTATELGKRVELDIEGEASELDRSVLERMVAPLEHMLRNAIAHGVEPPEKRLSQGKEPVGRILLRVSREGSEVVLQVKDDGAGIPLEMVREKVQRLGLVRDVASLSDHDLMQFILESGFSTADQVSQISGRGVGMDVVNSEIKQLGGVLAIDSTQGEGTTFTVRLPFTLAITQSLLVQTGEDVYAVPLSSIEGIVRMRARDLDVLYAEQDPQYEYAGNQYEVKHLGALLDVSQPQLHNPEAMFPVLLVRSGDVRIALQVDNLQGSREVVIKSVGPQVAKVKGISGATILGDGRVVMILDIPALVRAGAGVQLIYHGDGHAGAEESRATIMVVDDSITIRKVTARALERHHYQVLTAKDGLDALALLQDTVPDLILLDIEMPRMDGFELATHVRNDLRLSHIPIIMITSRTGDKHRQRALEIGVNHYLGKPYQEADLLSHIQELLEAQGTR